MADNSTGGSLAALDAAGALAIRLDTGRSRTVGAELTVPTAFTGTVLFEGTIDGATWFAANCTDVAGVTATNSLTAAGRRLVTCAGLTAVRARCSAFTSGACLVALAGSP